MFKRVPAALLAAAFAFGLSQASAMPALAASAPTGAVHMGAEPINQGRAHTRAVELAGQGTGGTAAATGGQLLSGGGAVLTNPKLYISYWGPEWVAGFSTGGYSSRQAQTYLESFFGGVGGSGWLASTSQYCGAIARGSSSCPQGGTIANSQGQLAGTWLDQAAVPASPLTTDIAAAAARAAQHFGQQPGAVYMVVTPSGKSELDFGSKWCAWHGTTSISVGGQQFPYTYLPYQPDAGTACGVNYINPSDAFGRGYFDGFSIVAGHEYAEAITDPFPGSGWVDSVGSENGDKCAWALARSANASLSTGSFAVQPLWSNSAASCVLSAPVAPSSAPPPTPAPLPQTFNGGAFNPTSPSRVLDTRSGLGGPYGGLGSGQTMDVQIAGLAGVPLDATSVALNVTVTAPSASGYLTVYPAGAGRPTASNLNFTSGQTVANLVQVPLGAGGKLSFFNASGYVDVIGDINGYTAGTGNSYTTQVPHRLLDTRSTGRTLGPGQSLDLPAGLPGGAVAAVLNVTATNTTAAGYLTVWPSDRTRPTASNLNFSPGRTVPNRVVVQLSASGSVSIFNFAGTADVVVDIDGYYSAPAPAPLTAGTAPTFTGVTPTRLLDTRLSGRTLGAGGVLALSVAGSPSGVPAGAKAVVLNVTITNTSGAGYLTVWPAGAGMPTASDLNWAGGQTVPNLVFTSVGSGGSIDFYNAMGSADLVVDLAGYYS